MSAAPLPGPGKSSEQHGHPAAPGSPSLAGSPARLGEGAGAWEHLPAARPGAGREPGGPSARSSRPGSRSPEGRSPAGAATVAAPAGGAPPGDERLRQATDTDGPPEPLITDEHAAGPLLPPARHRPAGAGPGDAPGSVRGPGAGGPRVRGPVGHAAASRPRRCGLAMSGAPPEPHPARCPSPAPLGAGRRPRPQPWERACRAPRRRRAAHGNRLTRGMSRAGAARSR